MAKQVTAKKVIARLRYVKVPDLNEDIVSLGLVSAISIEEGIVRFSLSIDPTRREEGEDLRLAAEQVVSGMEGVIRTVVVLTSHSESGRRTERKTPGEREPAAFKARGPKEVVAIISGKGGVGKSTLAANLALALQESGLRIGLLDADIYGPSIPHLLGIHGRPISVDGKTFFPLEGRGLKVISMGFFIEEEAPTIWRGPMIASMLMRMLRDVHWGELDILLIDTPPGTGDISLTLAQKTPLSGVLAVSTPQRLALANTRKGINMFRKMNVPILGLVENMSYFSCPFCKARTHIFGHGEVHKEATRTGVAFLGEIPVDAVIHESPDTGSTYPGNPHAEIYRDIAGKLLACIRP